MALAGAAQRFYEVYHQGNLHLLDELLAPGYIGLVNGREIVGAEAAKGVVGMFLTAFPDVRFSIEDVVSAGDRVVTRWSAAATHHGAFAGVEPTGRRVTMTGITIFQVAGEHIAALWNVWDMFGLLQQLRE